MKKLILLFVLSLISFVSFSQDYYYSTKFRIGKYNEYTKEWNYEPFEDMRIKIELVEKLVRIYDQANSYYIITSQGEKVDSKDYKATYWYANDEKDRRVRVSIVHYFETDAVVLMITYTNTSFNYVLEKTNKSLSPYQ
jgi:hypothetical protein